MRCGGCEFRFDERDLLARNGEVFCADCFEHELELAAIAERNAFLAHMQRMVVMAYDDARCVLGGDGARAYARARAAELSRLERMARGVE